MPHPQYGLLHTGQHVDGLHQCLEITAVGFAVKSAFGFAYVGVRPQTPQAVETYTPDSHYGRGVERRVAVEPLAVKPQLKHRILHGIVGVVGITQQAARLADKARPHTSGFFFKTISFHAGVMILMAADSGSSAGGLREIHRPVLMFSV